MKELFSKETEMNMNQIFKKQNKNTENEKLKDLLDVKNIFIKNQTECNEFKNFLYDTSISLMTLIESNKKNYQIEEIGYPKDIEQAKKYIELYFDTFKCEEYRNKKIELERNISIDVKYVDEFLKIYVKPCTMLIVCFVYHYKEQMTNDELISFSDKIKSLESQLIEVTDLSVRIVSKSNLFTDETKQTFSKEKFQSFSSIFNIDSSISNTLENFGEILYSNKSSNT